MSTRARFHELSKRKLIDHILSLEDRIRQIEQFYNTTVVTVTPDQVDELRNHPYFISAERYAYERPRKGEIGRIIGYARFVVENEGEG